VLILMMFAGAAIRQFFVMRHGYKLGRNPHPLPYALVGVAVIVGVIVWLRPAPQPAVAAAAQPAAAAPVAYADVQKVLEQRCYMCHGAQVQMKNVRLDTPAALKPARAGRVPAGRGDQGHAHEQQHRHHRRRACADRAVVPGGRPGGMMPACVSKT
jgi:uncharacterized membrane protein